MQGFGVNTYKWVNEAGETDARQVPLASRSRASRAGPRPTPRAMQGRGARRPHQGPLRRDRRAASTPSGSCYVQMMDDDDHPELDFDPLDDTKVVAGERVPAAPRRHDGAQPQRPRTSSPRTSRSRSAPACWSTGSTSPTTRCSSGGRSPTRDTQRYRVGPNYLQLPVNRRRTAASRPTSATAQMAYYVDETRREPARQLRAVDHRRAARGARSPAHDEQGPEIAGPPDARADPAHQRLPAGRRALPALRAVGEGRPRRQPHRRCCRQCDRPIQERMVWHLFLCEDELGQRVGDGLGISRRRRPRPRAAGDPDAAPRPSSQRARQPRQQRPARRRAAS